jgi:hypothetical protein
MLATLPSNRIKVKPDNNALQPVLAEEPIRFLSRRSPPWCLSQRETEEEKERFSKLSTTGWNW